MRIVLACLLLLLAPAAFAKGPPAPPTPGALCQAAIAGAERGWKIPGGLLPAIARVESGRPDPATGFVQPWPWTINAEGVGHFFDSKEQAIAAVQELQARGVRSIDVGCMQVNLMHHPNAFATLDEAFDPAANALYAGRFLTSLYRQLGDWPVAAAAYHSQTPELGADYRRRVMLAWGRPDLMPIPPVQLTAPQTVAYRDFTPNRLAYRAFAPEAQVYGAFAPLPHTPGLPSVSRQAARRQPRLASLH